MLTLAGPVQGTSRCVIWSGPMSLEECLEKIRSGPVPQNEEAMEELGAKGRMVAIVTHISELAERMPIRFEVAKSPTTSTVTRTSV